MGGATRGGTAEPTSRDQNKRQERGQEREMIEEDTHRRQFLARKRGGEVEQSGAFYHSAKGGIEHVRGEGKSQLPRTTYGRWRWMVNAELDGR